MKKIPASSHPGPRLMAVAAGLIELGLSAAHAQPVNTAPLPPGFTPTGKTDGGECGARDSCNAVSQTFVNRKGQEMTRLSVRTGNEWNVCQVQDGEAIAYPLSSPSSQAPIAPMLMERIGRETDKADPAIAADPASDSIDRALLKYNRCKLPAATPIS